MKSKDIIITNFNQVNLSRMKMPFIVIYEHPKDYDKSYVARIFEVNIPTNIVIVSKDLESLREKIPQNMIKFKRRKEDDKNIIESYC